MTGEMTEAVFDNTFKKNMQARRVQTGLWSSLASNIVAEILSFAGFDWILFDTEHAPNDVATLIPQLQALKGSMTTPIVRPVWNDQLEFKRLLDIGFHNFIVPFVQTRQEAEYAVSSVRYPPHGRRGVSVGARGSCFGYASDYWHRIDEHIGLVVQVETVEAAARIEDIFSVDGIDGIFIGPSDLAASMGHLANPPHREVQAKMAEIADVCDKIGAPLGTLATGAEDARRYIDMGYQFVGLGSDAGLIKKASWEMAQQFQG